MKKHLEWKSGYIRSRKDVELNWNVCDWALPFNLGFSDSYTFIGFLCFVLIIPRIDYDKAMRDTIEEEL